MKGQGNREFSVKVYTNSKGNERISVLFPYDTALLIATDDLDALDRLRVAIKRRLELEESRHG